jgi:H+/Cl- antiporter ClcA
VPRAAVVFVAEVTGRSGFIVPGLLAAVVAELTRGRSSVTTYQRGNERAGSEERATSADGYDPDA